MSYIYFDNAATSFKPDYVLNAVNNFYRQYPANVHRGVCSISKNSTDIYESARDYIGNFINANPGEIIFTHGATESLNLVANSICKSITTDRNIIISTEMEHSSNILPWQKYCEDSKRKKIHYVQVLADGSLDYNGLGTYLKANGKNVFLLTVTHVSNAIGTVNDIKRIVALCKQYGILTCVDAAQSIAHFDIDVKDIDCDFLAFSGHKVYAPFGIGVLYGKKELLDKMQPFMYGGGQRVSVEKIDTDYSQCPSPIKFEPGTQNLSGVHGLAAAFQFMNFFGTDKIRTAESNVYNYAVYKIQTIPSFRIIGTPRNSAGIISIVHEKMTSHDVAKILDQNEICVRSGLHCAHLLMDRFGLNNKKNEGTVRLSFCLNNTLKEVDHLHKTLSAI